METTTSSTAVVTEPVKIEGIRQVALEELKSAKEGLGITQRMLALVDMESRLRALVDGLDDRTRFVVAGLADIGFLDGTEDVGYTQDMWSELVSDGEFLGKKAHEYRDDPELGTLAKAVRLARGLDEEDPDRQERQPAQVQEHEAKGRTLLSPGKAHSMFRPVVEWLASPDRTIREKLATVMAYRLSFSNYRDGLAKNGLYAGDISADLTTSWGKDLETADLDPEDKILAETVAMFDNLLMHR